MAAETATENPVGQANATALLLRSRSGYPGVSGVQFGADEFEEAP